MRLGAVQGVVKDADGSTIYDWAAELGQAIRRRSISISTRCSAAGVLRQRCTTAVRSMTRA